MDDIAATSGAVARRGAAAPFLDEETTTSAPDHEDDLVSLADSIESSPPLSLEEAPHRPAAPAPRTASSSARGACILCAARACRAHARHRRVPCHEVSHHDACGA